MRFFVPLLVVLPLLLPTFEGKNNDNDPANNNLHYTLQRNELGEQEIPKKSSSDPPKFPPIPTNSQTTRKKNLKALQREQKLKEQRQVLLTLKEQLKKEGIPTEFLDKFLKEGSKTRAKIFERLIKKAKKKIAKSVKKKNKRKRRRRGNKRVKEAKEVNLFSGKNIPSIKSLTGGNSRSRVRGSLNPCPTGQSRK
ncbi:hypothetical protein Avbf_16677 [Armadillidium vulgare]|nr:hypothetical protein Avbf_16677 [Armadillidium vulgare]